MYRSALAIQAAWGHCYRHRAKHSEYSVLDIPKYWIVDPLENRITVGYLQSGRYDDKVFVGRRIICSDVLSDLALTAQ